MTRHSRLEEPERQRASQFSAYHTCYQCSEKVLLMPHPRDGQTLNDVLSNRSEWLLLDRSRISFDGSDCNKVLHPYKVPSQSQMRGTCCRGETSLSAL